MRLVVMGPPGSGKGTQGPAIAAHLGVPYVSTGDVLRSLVAADTDLGHRVSAVIDRGDLVPDDLMVAVVAAALGDHDGYVLDGFPRTLHQLKVIEDPGSPLKPPDVAVHLALTDDDAHERLARRAREEGRADDADPSVIDRRLSVYKSETEPLFDQYRQRGILVTVDGDRPRDEVTAAILAAIGSGSA